MDLFMRGRDSEYGKCDGVLHEIRKGDSLYRLSKTYHVSIDEILERNPDTDVYDLKIGDRLCVPIKQMPYVTVEGDTLDCVLDRFHIDLETFRKANPQLKPFAFPVNTVLYIPDALPEMTR